MRVRQGSTVLVTGNRDNPHGRISLGKIVIQPGKMTAKHLRGLSRAGHERSVNTAAAKIRAHAHPAQRGIFKPGLGAIGPSVRPTEATGGSVPIERGESVVSDQ
jgi:hypothetical protein